ncbi:FecR family protein [Pseudoflavitalea rhizosphaerae]|uniref:FecR family protein n=1 Tax=Pseudoflavitalea rhizosphaerae TaxID=1884793 RepID=UPI000F8F4083|nr:FecR domain-containing protein [Pseudoflavitalea rhizosphaerae]
MQTEQRFRELLDKYLAGACSPQEKEILEKWFEKGGNFHRTDLELSEDNRLQLLDRIHAEQDRQAFVNNKKKNSKLRIMLTGWRAAAVWSSIIISAGIVTWKSGILKPLFNSSGSQVAYRLIQTGKGEVKHFLLPDGSEITLNANSRLEYHPGFREHRKIRLHGEALFSVAHNKSHPFSVSTSDSLATTVLGTRFNIQSYDKSQETRITVVSGIVAVNRGKQCLDTLTRSQAIRYQRTAKSYTISHDVNTETVTGWTKGEWDYENLRFNDLAILLQNHFGITLSSKLNTDLLQTGVSVNFNRKQSAIDILGVFCSFAGCSFRETGPNSIELH